jgi:hypothetical protein
MADKKISQLTALSAANLAPSTDVLAIVDTSATETKKVTAKDLVDGALNGGTANGVLYLNGSKVATSGSAFVFDGTNLGLGVTPSAWVSDATAIQTGSYSSFAQGRGGTSDLVVSWNAIVTSGTTSGTGYVYKVTGDLASAYEQNGTHRWYTASSGTAGNAITFTQAMTLDADGDLLVGNTASVQSSRAEFTSTSLTPAFLARVNANSDEGQWAGQFQKKTATNTTSQIFVRFLINDGAAASGYITANGASAATFTSSSDVRIKENIAELPSQWSSIKALRPVEFDYIESEGGGHQIGFIAQDFEQVYPDSVGERPDGMKMLSGWSKTEARMVKALQEAMTRIEQLEAKVAALEAK